MALTQKEIDALIDSVLEQKTEGQQTAQGRLRLYDFRRPDKFSKDHLRGAQLIFDSFCRHVTSHFSALFRTAVHFEVDSIDQLTYSEFSGELSNPCCVALVKMGELPSSMLINAELAVMLPLLDRLCGGQGDTPTALRTLTEIEVSMTRRMLLPASRLFSETLADFNMGHHKADLTSIEVNPHFIQQIMAPSDTVLSASFLVRFGTQSGHIEFCLPHATLEPILSAFSLSRWFGEKAQGEKGKTGPVSSPAIDRLEVPISCRLGKTVLSVGEIMSLRKGDVIETDLAKGAPASLYVFGKPKFYAKVGILGKKLAAQIIGVHEDGEGDQL